MPTLAAFKTTAARPPWLNEVTSIPACSTVESNRAHSASSISENKSYRKAFTRNLSLNLHQLPNPLLYYQFITVKLSFSENIWLTCWTNGTRRQSVAAAWWTDVCSFFSWTWFSPILGEIGTCPRLFSGDQTGIRCRAWTGGSPSFSCLNDCTTSSENVREHDGWTRGYGHYS